jgi:hypothetical protein
MPLGPDPSPVKSLARQIPRPSNPSPVKSLARQIPRPSNPSPVKATCHRGCAPSTEGPAARHLRPTGRAPAERPPSMGRASPAGLHTPARGRRPPGTVEARFPNPLRTDTGQQCMVPPPAGRCLTGWGAPTLGSPWNGQTLCHCLLRLPLGPRPLGDPGLHRAGAHGHWVRRPLQHCVPCTLYTHVQLHPLWRTMLCLLSCQLSTGCHGGRTTGPHAGISDIQAAGAGDHWLQAPVTPKPGR